MVSNLPVSQNVELSDLDFQKISRLIYDECGIHLSEGKKELVKARLGKRIRDGDFKSFRQYYEYVIQDQSGGELIHLLDFISTNFTGFFREQKHFDYLQSDILPELMAKKRTGVKRLRFWSAGCSSGEEPYSIATVLLETIDPALSWDLLILGTDLSSRMLKTAQAGIYREERIQSVAPALIKKYFLKGDHPWEGYVKVKDHVRRYVQFRRLNLMEPFDFKDPFDCIFCRNVMIYFDKKTRGNLAQRFHGCLERGGFLVIGHSESLSGIQHPFNYVKPTVYKKS